MLLGSGYTYQFSLLRNVLLSCLRHRIRINTNHVSMSAPAIRHIREEAMTIRAFVVTDRKRGLADCLSPCRESGIKSYFSNP
jgi:hypothetical protein